MNRISINSRAWLKVLILCTNIFFTSAYADLQHLPLLSKSWKPIFAMGVGTATSSDLAQSQNFPIQNPTTDEFYRYAGNHFTQTSSLLSGFIGAERSLVPNWLIDIGIEYNQASPFTANSTYSQGLDQSSANTYHYYYHILSRQLLLESKWLYSLKKCYHPYLLAGLGASFNKAYNYYTNVPPDLTFTRMYANNTSTSFSYAIGIGIDADISSLFRLGLGYRFVNLGNIQLGNATIDNINVSGSLSQSHFYTNEWLAQLTAILG